MLVDGKPPRFEIVDPADRALHLGRARTRISCPVSPPPQPLSMVAAGRLSQAVPQEIPGRGQARRADEEEQGQEVDGAAHPHGPAIPAGESGTADARSLAQHDHSRRPSSSSSSATPFPPRRRERAAAALYRPVRPECQLLVDHPGQDRRRRKRPAGDRHRLRRLHLPEGRREALSGEGQPVEDDAGVAPGAAAQPQLRRRRSGGRCCATCACAARCRWRSTGDEINMAVFFGLAKESADTVLPESPLFRPEFAEAWIAHDPDQANALLDEAGLDRARRRRHPPAAGRPPGADHRRDGRRKHARDRCARTGHRSLAQGRHRPVHPHVAARRVPQPRASAARS